MFQPPLFREDRTQVLHELMRSHSFATMVTLQKGEFCADHLPLSILVDDSSHGTIQGHVAKRNPLVANAQFNANVMVVFQGPHAYISPSWYESKDVHGKVVPTWNYAVVHAHGVLSLIDDPEWKARQLHTLTASHESHRANPWTLSDAPDDFIERQLDGIVGIEIAIERLEGKWKVSQNRDDADRQGVRRGLSLEGDANAKAIAKMVAERSG